jgi:hypothetical protein
MKTRTKLLLENTALLGGTAWLLRKRLQGSVFPLTSVVGREPDQLNLGVPAGLDAAHPMKGMSAFEWWYFDATFTDGHTFAAAFGNMKPQVYMHINCPDGKELRVFDKYPKSSYVASPDECDVKIEQSRVHGTYPVYEMDAYGRNGVEAHLKFENMLPGWAHGDGQYMIGSYADPRYFGWCVAQPRAKVTGTMKYDGKEFAVEGEGYHDHNWGDFNFYTYLSRWIWGRITTDELSVDFADVIFNKSCGGVHLPLIMVARGDRIVFETFNVEWKYDDYRLDDAGEQCYPHKLSCVFSERDVKGTLEYTTSGVLETDDMMKDMKIPDWAIGPIGKYIARPIYYRLNADYTGAIDFGEEHVDVAGEMIVEYMLFNLRRGQVPKEKGYKHFLKPAGR